MCLVWGDFFSQNVGGQVQPGGVDFSPEFCEVVVSGNSEIFVSGNVVFFRPEISKWWD